MSRMVLIAGGSGVGKTSAVRELPKDKYRVVHMDEYIDHSQAPLTPYGPNNDHPDVIDWKRLIADIESIHDEKRLIVVEGTLVLTNDYLRKKALVKIFVDINDDERIRRRIEKTLPEDLHYIYEILQPSHERYVVPSREHADAIIAADGMTSADISNNIEQITAGYIKR